MKQDWEDLGSEYEGSSSVLIGDVDCTVHSGLCSKHGVQGYPTWQLDGKLVPGERDLDGIEEMLLGEP